MLLQLYYLYKKSTKKTRELMAVVEELKEVFELPDSGIIPIRSEGSRWINHKRRVLQRVADRYGAYISHLNVLAEDNSIKSEHRARIKGYSKKLSECMILVGCALYTEFSSLLRFLVCPCKGSNIDIYFAIKQILKATSALKSLESQDPLQWPMVKQVVDHIKSDTNGEKNLPRHCSYGL